jgi:hypothetical protein
MVHFAYLDNSHSTHTAVKHLHQKPPNPREKARPDPKQDALQRANLPSAVNVAGDVVPCWHPRREHPLGVGDLEVEGCNRAHFMLPSLRLWTLPSKSMLWRCVIV